MQIRVYYEDTDCGGIVYHANYIKYCERARSEIFFCIDKTPFDDDNIFVVKNIDASFISSSHLGDILDVKTEILELKNVILVLKQDIYNKGKLIFSMKCKLGFVNKTTLKPVKITPSILEVLNENL